MKLLIVDDHPVVREGLVALLQQGRPDTVVVEAHDSAAGLAMAENHLDLDVVLLDLALPGMGGMSAIAEFGRRRPELPVIILSSSEDPLDVRRALAAGALGYVPKSASRQTLLLDRYKTLPPNFEEDPIGHVQAYTFGYDRDFRLTKHITAAPGAQFTTYTTPQALKSTYGNHPWSITAFVRFRIAQ